jgi:hypothetical protein
MNFIPFALLTLLRASPVSTPELYHQKAPRGTVAYPLRHRPAQVECCSRWVCDRTTDPRTAARGREQGRAGGTTAGKPSATWLSTTLCMSTGEKSLEPESEPCTNSGPGGPSPSTATALRLPLQGNTSANRLPTPDRALLEQSRQENPHCQDGDREEPINGQTDPTLRPELAGCPR